MRQPPEYSAHGTLLGFLVEAKAGKDACGTRGRGMRADIGQALVDLGDAIGIVRSLGLAEQPRALLVGREHEVEQAVRSAGGFLRHPADAGRARDVDAAAVGMDLAGDQAQQRGLARAVAADESDLVAGRNAGRGLVEEDAPFDAVGQVVDMQHCASQ